MAPVVKQGSQDDEKTTSNKKDKRDGISLHWYPVS